MMPRIIDTHALPSPSRGGAGGGGRAACDPVGKVGLPWEREASSLSTERTRGQAGALRRRLTPPEKRLWWHLRHTLGLEGTHVGRQVAIGRDVADFCCLPLRLVIEVDGEQHGFDANAARDAGRTAFLESQGFRVLRFGNREVMLETPVVIDTILAACGPTPPTPGPSPQGGGERAGPTS